MAGCVGHTANSPAFPNDAVLVAVAVDGQMAGHLVMADPLRTGDGDMLAGLRGLGINRIFLAIGDWAGVATRVTLGLGLVGSHAGRAQDGKVQLVVAEQATQPP